MKYIVYLTKNTKNEKIYIGVHKTENPDVFDGYLGCGVYRNSPSSYKRSKTPFQFAVNKYGIDSFKRTTLKVFDCEEDANKLRDELVDMEFISRRDTYNSINTKVGDLSDQEIHLYTIEGDYYKTYNTPLECARDFGLKTSSEISSAIRLGRLFKNYQVSLERVEKMGVFEIPITRGKPVGCYTTKGKLVEEFSTIAEAIKKYGHSVSRVLKGQQKTTKGFIFKFL